MKKFLFALFSILLAGPALAQSNPGLYYGQVPTAAQWNSYFAAKQDNLGYPPVNKGGDTMTGKLVTTPSKTVQAGFNVPEGTAPATPLNGDLWTTPAGAFVRIEGVTLSVAGSSAPPTLLTSIAALKAIPVASAPTLGNVILNGYYSANDLGFLESMSWNGASSASDDGCTVINPTGNAGNGRWLLLWNGNLNVRQCGAKWDNSTDDTTAVGTTWSDVYAYSSGTGNGGNVLLPCGGTGLVSGFSKTWNADRTVNMIGCGPRSTTIAKYGSSGANVLAFSANTGIVQVGNSRFSGFMVDCRGNAITGISFTTMAVFSVDDIESDNCNHSFDNLGGIEVTYNNPVAYSSTVGLYTKASSGFANNIVTVNRGVFQLDVTAMDLNDGSIITINQTDFERDGTASNAGTGSVFIRNNLNSGDATALVTMNGVWFEAEPSGTCGICAATPASNNNTFLTVNGARMSGLGATMMNIGGIQNVTLNNVIAATGGDTATLAAISSNINASAIATLTDTSISRQVTSLTTSATTTSAGSSNEITGTLVSGNATISYHWNNGDSIICGEVQIIGTGGVVYKSGAVVGTSVTVSSLTGAADNSLVSCTVTHPS